MGRPPVTFFPLPYVPAPASERLHDACVSCNDRLLPENRSRGLCVRCFRMTQPLPLGMTPEETTEWYSGADYYQRRGIK